MTDIFDIGNNPRQSTGNGLTNFWKNSSKKSILHQNIIEQTRDHIMSFRDLKSDPVFYQLKSHLMWTGDSNRKSNEISQILRRYRPNVSFQFQYKVFTSVIQPLTGDTFAKYLYLYMETKHQTEISVI